MPDQTALTWPGKGPEVLEKDGTHHFDGNYLLIAHQILDGFERRIANWS